MKMMIPLILIILGVSGVESDSHSIRYYETAVSSPGSGLPVYSVVGYLDDKEIENYNSDTRQYLPKTEWMKKLGPDYWERNTQNNRGNEPVFKHNVQTLMSRFNQTGGIHSFQRMYGCELRDDGTTEGYMQFGYDGRDFMSLDTQRGIWIPTMNEAQISTQRWNSPEERVGERYKNYLENICMEELKQFIEYGREDLERRDPKAESGNTPIIISVVVVAVVLIIGAVIGLIIYRRRSGKTPGDRTIYVPAHNNEENASNSSSNNGSSEDHQQGN